VDRLVVPGGVPLFLWCRIRRGDVALFGRQGSQSSLGVFEWPIGWRLMWMPSRSSVPKFQARPNRRYEFLRLLGAVY
jgi:hypothetical protein